MKPRKGVIIALWLLLVLIFLLIIDRTRFSADLSAFMPANPTAHQQVFTDQLQSGVATRLILVAIEGADTETLAVLSREVAHQLRGSEAFTFINNGEPVDNENQRQFVFTHRYLLSPAVNPQRFSIEGLRDAIQESIELLASPAGLLIKPLMARDPTGETFQLINTFNQEAAPHTFEEVWVSENGARAILLAQTAAAGTDIDGQQHAMQLIKNTFNHAKEDKGVNARLVMTGPGVFSVNARDTIEKEVKRLSIFSTIIIISLLLLIYRSFTAVLLGTLPVLTGIAAGIAAVSLGFGVVHGVTLGFGITLIGEAIDYSIYLFLQSKYNKAQVDKQAWLASFWPTIRLGVLTSIIGFSALLFSGFPGLAQLGLYSTAGLIAAAVVTRFVLPALLPRNFHVRDVARFGKVFNPISKHARPLRWGAVILLLTACSIIYSHQGNILNRDLAALSPVPAADRALDAALRNDLGTPNLRYFIVASGENVESALIAAEEISAKLEPLIKEGVIASYNSPSHYLPSVATQTARQAAIPESPLLTQRLDVATSTLPISSERLIGFLEDAQNARRAPPLQYTDLAGTPLALVVETLLVKQATQWSVLLPLYPVTYDDNEQAIDPERIRAALAETMQTSALFIDVKAELEQMYAGYLSEILYLSLSGLIAIVILLLITLRSLRRAARVLLPLLVAVTVVIAGLVWWGYPLTILHLIGLLLTIAIGSNYALFFDRQINQTANEGYRRTLASLLFANTTTVTIFSLLAFSSVPILQNIGMTVAPGVVLALLFAAIFAKREIPSISKLAS